MPCNAIPRYVKSRNDKQLRLKEAASMITNCEPEATSQDGAPIVPCGLIAWSLFNDTYSFSLNKKAVEVNKKNIAWDSDKNTKFGSDVFPSNFQKGGLIGGAKLNEKLPVSAVQQQLLRSVLNVLSSHLALRCYLFHPEFHLGFFPPCSSVESAGGPHRLDENRRPPNIQEALRANRDGHHGERRDHGGDPEQLQHVQLRGHQGAGAVHHVLDRRQEQLHRRRVRGHRRHLPPARHGLRRALRAQAEVLVTLLTCCAFFFLFTTVLHQY